MKKGFLSLVKAILIFGLFIGCSNSTQTNQIQTSDMETLTEDMIDEWIIGTWEFESNLNKIKSGECEIKGIEDDADVIIKYENGQGDKKRKETKFKNLRDSLSDPQSKISEFSNISNYSIKVNKERNKIQMKAIILLTTYECIATKIK